MDFAKAPRSLERVAFFREVLKVVVPYLLVAALWIYFSDRLVGSFASDAGAIVFWSMIKGWLFVIVTGGLLALLVSRMVFRLRLAQIALSASEAKFRTVFESSADAVMILDGHGFFDCNNQTVVLFQCASKEGFLGLHPADLSPPTQPDGCESRTVANRWIARALKGEVCRFEWTHKRCNGKAFPAEVLLSRLDLEGRTVLQATVRDITERQRAEEQLRFQAMLLDQISDTVTATDLDGKITYVNAAQCLAVGCSREELLGKSVQVYGEDPSRGATQREIIEATLAHGRWRGEVVNRDQHGREHIIACRTTFVRDASGKPIGMCGAGTDITGTKQAEQTLRESEERFRGIVESGEAGYFRIDREGRFETVNAAWLRTHGYDSASEVIGQHYSLTQTPEDLDRAHSIVKELLNGEFVPVGEFTHRCRDGSVGYHTFSVSSVRKGGQVVGLEGFLIDTTALHRVQGDYQMLFERMLDGFALHEIVCNAEGKPVDYRFLSVNPAFEKLTGLSAKQIAGRRLSEVIPDTEPFWIETYGRVALTGEPANFEHFHASLGRHFQVSAFRPAPRQFACIFVDITAHKQAESAVRDRLEMESRLSKLAAQIPGMLYTFRLRPDGACCLPYTSPSAERIFGVNAQETQRDAEAAFRFIHPADLKAVKESILDSARSLSPWRQEFRVIHAQRGVIWIEGYSTPEREPDGSILWHGILNEITERRRVEELIRKLSSAVEQSSVSVVITDLKGNIEYVNPKFTQVTGYATAEVIGQNPRILKSGRMSAEAYREMWQTITSGKEWHGEFQNKKKNGELYWEEAAISPIRDANGVITHYLGIKEDVTAHKLAEAALARDEAELSAIYENTPMMMVLLDADRRIRRVNQAALEFSEQTEAEVLGTRGGDLLGCIHALDDPRGCGFGPDCGSCPLRLAVQETVDTGRAQRRIEAKPQLVRGQQTQEYFVLASTARLFVDGQPLVLLCLENITRQKQLEKQFLQSQKMEAVGQLAGGVAHDFNNILAAMLLQLQLVEGLPEVTEEIAAAHKELEKGAQRAANLTRQLLMFSRRQTMQTKPLDLNELVEGLLKMLRRLLGEHIEVDWQPSPSPTQVEADAGMLEQVVVNLCVNARDAMSKGGQLDLATRLVEVSAEAALSHVDGREGRFVCLTVRDNGCGMDEALLGRIFEPFFTTKEAGRGTGLGLATVHGIVKQHRGWVTVESKVGAGSTFSVYLPCTVVIEPQETPLPAEEDPRGSETILLVEDDHNLRLTLRVGMRKLGYRVLECVNAVEALQLWDQHGGHVDLLLTDVVLPQGMSGLELADRIRELKPDLKVVISSGYSPDLVGAQKERLSGFTFLPKPYDKKKLARTIRSCLDGVEAK